jgi:hypothetical protein
MLMVLETGLATTTGIVAAVSVANSAALRIIDVTFMRVSPSRRIESAYTTDMG